MQEIKTGASAFPLHFINGLRDDEMAAKEYLSAISLLDLKIDQWIIERQWLLKLMNRYSKAAEMEKEVSRIIACLEIERNAIVSKIQKITEQTYNALLYKKYVQLKNLREIAFELNYSEQYVRHLHRRALKEFEKVHAEIWGKNQV